jgi:hypothetical protein
MQELLDLVQRYCDSRNLIFSSYVQGMTRGEPLDARTISTLIRYHKEWMR